MKLVRLIKLRNPTHILMHHPEPHLDSYPYQAWGLGIVYYRGLSQTARCNCMHD